MESLQPGEVLDELTGRQSLVETHGRCQEADATSDLQRAFSDIDAIDERRARRRGKKRGEDPERRGLPCAVGTQESIDLARIHLEAHVSYGLDGRISLDQMVESDHRVTLGRVVRRARGRLPLVLGIGNSAAGREDTPTFARRYEAFAARSREREATQNG